MTEQISHPLYDSVSMYFQLGFSPIPIGSNQKYPPLNKGWKTMDPSVQWEHPRVSPNSNIGLRCGGPNHFAVFDIDETKLSGSVEYAKRYFNKLGINPPEIISASGFGRHFYIFIKDPPINGHRKDLNGINLRGEFMYGMGVYVVAPPSKVDGHRYELVSGDFKNIPTIKWDDIVPLLSFSPGTRILKTKEETSDEILFADTEIPILPIVSEISIPTLPFEVRDLILGKNEISIGKRSNFDYRIIQHLVQNQFDFNQIYAVFETYPCAGKYSGKGKYKIQWLYSQFIAACEVEKSVFSRFAKAVINFLNLAKLPGRTGISDGKVLLAHFKVMERTGEVYYFLSVRECSELTRLGIATVERAQKRLIDQGLIIDLSHIFTRNIDNLKEAKTYSINFVVVSEYVNSYVTGRNGTLHSVSPLPTVECSIIPELSKEYAHDVFERIGIGKSAERIYSTLRENRPLTINGIAEITGITTKTIKKYLILMSKFTALDGEEYSITVEISGGYWFALSHPILLDLFAQSLGVDGKSDERKAKHRLERQHYGEMVDRIKQRISENG